MLPGSEHSPVMLRQCMEVLGIKADGCYVDCTFGRGGHSAALLAGLGPTGRLFAFDRDRDAISSRPDLARDPRIQIQHGRFSTVDSALEERGLVGKVHGILMDLGVSSPQLDNPDRGFSFRGNGPLDMRMDQSSGATAAEWLERAPEADIRQCLWDFGEERMARRIAARICATRVAAPLRTTQELAALVSTIVRRDHRIDPATRTFQALRIMVNDELGELRSALARFLKLLAVGGRIVVLSFHSLEDRIVKRFFRDTAKASADAVSDPRFALVFRKPLGPTEDDIALNPRARSARLRALERST